MELQHAVNTFRVTGTVVNKIFRNVASSANEYLLDVDMAMVVVGS